MDRHPVSHHRAEGMAVRGAGRAVLPLLWLGLSGCENLRGRQEAERRTITRPSHGYIKTEARPVPTFRPDRTQGSKFEAKRPFLERLAHAQRPPRQLLAPSHQLRGRTGGAPGRKGGRRFAFAETTAPKKVRRVVRFRILFIFSSFSLLQQGPGKGIPRKGSFPVKEPGSEPPY
jgi:hypothetical protein